MSNELITALGFLIIFVATTAGAEVVFLFKKEISEKENKLLPGYTAGIKINANVWCLLLAVKERPKI